MKTSTKILITVAVVALGLGTGIRMIFPSVVRAPTMSARLVDGKTGNPISGAGVTVSVDLVEAGLAMCSPKRKEIHNYQATTDNEGYFEVPAWSKPIPSGWVLDRSESPWVAFSKDGYLSGPGWKGFHGGSESTKSSLIDMLAGVEVMSSQWDHRKILLYKDGELPRGTYSDIIPLDKPVGYIVFAGEQNDSGAIGIVAKHQRLQIVRLLSATPARQRPSISSTKGCPRAASFAPSTFSC